MLQQIGFQREMQNVPEGSFKMPNDNQYLRPSSNEGFIIYHGNQAVEFGNSSQIRETMNSVSSIVQFNDGVRFEKFKDGGGYINYLASAASPYKLSISSGITDDDYHEDIYKSFVSEGNGNLKEYNYTIFKDDKTVVLNESYIIFEVKGNGKKGVVNKDVIENVVTYYDIRNSQMATFVMSKKGEIKNFESRPLNKEELSQIKSDVVELRSEAIEAFEKSPAHEEAKKADSLYYEKNNPLPQKTKDGRGSIDIEKFLENTNKMIEGHQLKVQNKGSYVLKTSAEERFIS